MTAGNSHAESASAFAVPVPSQSMGTAETPALAEPLDALSAPFCCPGERHAISRSLHLARLAAGHTACRTCEFRQETGLLPRRVVQRAVSRISRSVTPLVTAEGVRGVYVNQLTRERVTEVVQHVLELVHEERITSDAVSVRGGLRIVTGYDSRPMSPDLAIGMVDLLKKWGCEIADAGLVSRPAFEVAMEKYRPHAGLYLTGGDRPHAWNGLDLFDAEGLPWEWPGLLSRLDEKLHSPSNRIARTQGTYAAVSVQAEYEAALAFLFHAIRPLRIAIVCPDPLVRQTLKQQLDQTPCSPYFLQISPTLAEGTDRSSRLLTDLLCERRLDVGFLLGQDGRSCRVFDEGGHELSLMEMLQLLSPPQLDPSATPWIVRTGQPLPTAMSGQGRFTSGTEAELIREQKREHIPVAADDAHRFWFLGEVPGCDALFSVAKVLEVLSRADRPVSAYRHAPRSSRTSRL